MESGGVGYLFIYLFLGWVRVSREEFICVYV